MFEALDDMAYLVECAAVDYTGELKTELSRLCQHIRGGSTPYSAQVIRESLPALEECLTEYRTDKKSSATNRLVLISRDWWNAARRED